MCSSHTECISRCFLSTVVLQSSEFYRFMVSHPVTLLSTLYTQRGYKIVSPLSKPSTISCIWVRGSILFLRHESTYMPIYNPTDEKNNNQAIAFFCSTSLIDLVSCMKQPRTLILISSSIAFMSIKFLHFSNSKNPGNSINKMVPSTIQP